MIFQCAILSKKQKLLAVVNKKKYAIEYHIE